METGFELDISTYTSLYQPLLHNPSLTKSEVYINFYHRFKRFAFNDSDGTLVCTGLDPATHFPDHQINLSLFNHELSPIHLTNLIDCRLHHRTLSCHIASCIAAEAIQYVEFLHPYVMSLDVLLTQDLLFQNKEEEEEEEESTAPVWEEEEKEEEETCAICLEGLYDKDDEALDLPWCSHRFHHRCIGQWLLRQNSCPLCREIVL